MKQSLVLMRQYFCTWEVGDGVVEDGVGEEFQLPLQLDEWIETEV